MLKVRPGQRPSFTAMEDGAPRVRALHMATGLLRGVAGYMDFNCTTVGQASDSMTALT